MENTLAPFKNFTISKAEERRLDTKLPYPTYAQAAGRESYNEMRAQA